MKKNILIVIHKLSDGGAERAACNLANSLLESYNVYVVVFNLDNNSYECNANIIDLKNKSKMNFIKNIFKLKKIKKLYNINYSISFLTFPNLMNVLSRQKDKIIVTIRNNLKAQNKGKIINFLHKYSCKRADKVVCVSQGVRESQIKDFGIDENKVVAIYNRYDKERIEQLSKKEILEPYKSIFETNDIVLNIGRLEEQKMQEYLIYAFKEVVKELPKSKLVILGNGSRKKYLESLINNLNLKENVILIEFDSNPYKYINKSRILILTSKYEGMPNVIIESMALNVPVISSDCDFGPREIMKKQEAGDIEDVSYEKYGVLIPNHKSENFEKCISKSIIMLLKDKKRMEEYSRKSEEALEEFSQKNVMKKWEELLENLI